MEAITPADKLKRDEEGCAIRGVDEPGEGRVRIGGISARDDVEAIVGGAHPTYESG